MIMNLLSACKAEILLTVRWSTRFLTRILPCKQFYCSYNRLTIHDFSKYFTLSRFRPSIPTDTRGLKPIYMEVSYWALLFMPLVILQYLYRLQKKGIKKKIQFVPHRNHITSPLQNESGLKRIYMEMCYWALLFMPLYSLQIKGD
jgi:hypothetical protein